MSCLLYNKSCYSLLSSTIRINDLINHALDNHFEAIGLIDDNLFGVMDFYNACKANNIKPIIGLEAKTKINENVYHILIIAKNNEGYLNLVRLSLINEKQQFITNDQLKQYQENVYIIYPYDSYVESLFSQNKTEELLNFIKNLDNNAYIGLNSSFKAFYGKFNNYLINQSNEIKDRLIACKRALYAKSEDYQAYQTILAIKNQTTIYDNRLLYETEGFLYNKDQLKNYFNTFILENTKKLVDSIDLQIEKVKTSLPKFESKQSFNNKDYLRQLCLAGLNKRLNNKVNNVYLQRLNYELEIICQMNFDEYFLIIYDMILYARKNGIYVGPGRGSSVGCLVAYCLGITHIDPIVHNLLFERFLNPERISMPDIDIDLPDDRREEVINYLRKKYGDDHVAHIITFGTLAAKQVLKDAGKALNINENVIDILNKNIEHGINVTLDYTYNNSIRFKQAINSSDENKLLYNICLKLEGLPRHCSTHAGGIVLSNKKLYDVLPITEINNCYSTGYSMEYLEAIGLIKIDLLSISNLSVIDKICQRIGDIDILKVPLNDKKTFDLICKGDTTGIFQIEKTWVKNVIKRFKPNKYEDIALIIALCRPGPMQYIDLLIDRKENIKPTEYIHNDLKDILESTFGIIIYQEQIMQIAQRFAGFTLGKADILRKAISKKKQEEIMKLKDEFINGAIKKGYESAVANKVYENIEKFANYGFNKSHAMVYGLVAYQQAYLKANYPLAFYNEILNGSIGDKEKIGEYIIELKSRQISIYQPSINKSFSEFNIENNGIRFPLTSIKNLSFTSSEQIVKERKQHGIFKSYFDAVARLTSCGINKRAIESLIKAGAFDEFKFSHISMIESIEEAIRYGKLCEVENNGQISIDLDLVSEPIINNKSDNIYQIIDDQYEHLGLYLYKHPISNFRVKYPNAVSSLKIASNYGNYDVLCLINKLKEHRTKNNELMCFISGNDEFGPIELVIMPKLYLTYKEKLKKGIILLVNGNKDDRQSLLVNSLRIIKE